MRVGVVGAGPAGLCSARHATAAGMSCTVFEQTDNLGGTWIYTDNVGTDKYGLRVHSSMYKNLRINLPKQIVKFPDLDHKYFAGSFITGENILEYLHNYADHFDIRKLIKFNNHVKKVTLKEGQWEVVALDLPSNKEETHVFDAICICTGLNETPAFPDIKGMQEYSGKSMHTHEYRKPEMFADQRVLVIGSGPSAMDTTNEISQKAKKVVMSHHGEHIKSCVFRENVSFKPDVKEIKTFSAVFMDDSQEEFDWIIYGTGFKVTYPFLDSSCEVSIDMKLVYPLYKHIINANHPTMALFGHMGYSPQLPMFDFHARLFVKTLMNDILPRKEEMLKEIDDHIQNKLTNGCTKRQIHNTTTEEDEIYCAQLSVMAGIQDFPRVHFKIHKRGIYQVFHEFPIFRKEIYEIIDDEDYIIKNENV